MEREPDPIFYTLTLNLKTGSPIGVGDNNTLKARGQTRY